MHSQTLDLLAAAGTGQGPPPWLSYLPLVAMGIIFYLLILRPQMRRQKEQQTKINSLKKGDQVLTGGGLIGKVLRVDGDYADVEIAPGIKVKALKSTIADIIPPAGGTPAND